MLTDERAGTRHRDELYGNHLFHHLFHHHFHRHFHRRRCPHHQNRRHGGIDVLVNNAGIAFKHAATEPFAVQAEVFYIWQKNEFQI